MIHLRGIHRTAVAVAVLLTLTCSALPAAAGELQATPPETAVDTTTPVRAAAAARLAALDRDAAAGATTQAPLTEPAQADQRPFFKTRKGALALALLAGGLGYTVYSFSHDRVSSPQR